MTIHYRLRRSRNQSDSPQTKENPRLISVEVDLRNCGRRGRYSKEKKEGIMAGNMQQDKVL